MAPYTPRLNPYMLTVLYGINTVWFQTPSFNRIVLNSKCNLSLKIPSNPDFLQIVPLCACSNLPAKLKAVMATYRKLAVANSRAQTQRISTLFTAVSMIEAFDFRSLLRNILKPNVNSNNSTGAFR